jgi:hypothetical protein
MRKIVRNAMLGIVLMSLLISSTVWAQETCICPSPTSEQTAPEQNPTQNATKKSAKTTRTAKSTDKQGRINKRSVKLAKAKALKRKKFALARAKARRMKMLAEKRRQAYRRLVRRIHGIVHPTEVRIKQGESAGLTLIAVDKKGNPLPVTVRAVVPNFDKIVMARVDNQSLSVGGKTVSQETVKAWVPGTKKWHVHIPVLVEAKPEAITQDRPATPPASSATPTSTATKVGWVAYLYSKDFGSVVRRVFGTTSLVVFLIILVLIALLVTRSKRFRRWRAHKVDVKIRNRRAPGSILQ